VAHLIPAKGSRRETKLAWLFSLFLTFSLLITGCASSDVSRNAAANVDQGIQNASNLVNGTAGSDIATSYQNTSQGLKGGLMGGAVGAIFGYAYPTTIGLLPGIAIGAIFGAAYGKYIDSYATPQDQLINRGVNVIQLGDQINMVVPSWRIFDAYTSSITPDSYSTLQMIANYINTYTKTLVRIAVYTADSGSPEADCAFSQQEADRVERFLIAAGVNARVLYAQGGGSTHLVSKDPEWGGPNYRIEISFEKLYV